MGPDGVNPVRPDENNSEIPFFAGLNPSMSLRGVPFGPFSGLRGAFLSNRSERPQHRKRDHP